VATLERVDDKCYAGQIESALKNGRPTARRARSGSTGHPLLGVQHGRMSQKGHVLCRCSKRNTLSVIDARCNYCLTPSLTTTIPPPLRRLSSV
jgi:hypothetical protein